MKDDKKSPEIKIRTKSEPKVSPRIILFNDEWHTFEEVIEQIILATGYRIAKAETMTWEVHTCGRSTIYTGNFYRCLEISSILEDINLSTEVRY